MIADRSSQNQNDLNNNIKINILSFEEIGYDYFEKNTMTKIFS